MPVVYSSNEDNDDSNIYISTTLTPVYRITRDSFNNQSESSKNNNQIQKSNQNNTMTQQQFNDSSPSCSTSSLTAEGAAVCAVCGDVNLLDL